MVLGSCSLDYSDKTTPADQVPLMVFENLRQTSVKDGKVLYTVESEGSENYPSRKQVMLKRFRFQEYDSLGQPASVGEAESAVIDTGSNDATITGQLKATSEEQGVTLLVVGGMTGGLTWKNDDRILKTLPDTSVSLTKKDGSKIVANAMTLDLGSNKLELEDGIQGLWTPETKHDENASAPVIPPATPPP